MACPHGMPTPASCVDCMNDGPITPQVIPSTAWAGVGDGDNTTKRALGPLARTTATMDGDCPACGFSIAVGDTIALPAEGEPWIHERCWTP